MDHHHTVFPLRGEHGINRTIVNTAALAGAAYMGFRLIKLINYWNRGESDMEASDALALSNALHSSNAIEPSRFEALDLPFGQQYTSSWMTSSGVMSPNPTFQRRLHQLARGRGNSLPSTPRSSMFFPMNMPLDVGINSLLCGLSSPDDSKAIIRVNSLKFDKQLQAFGLEVMQNQSEQSLKSVSELDAKCLVKLVSTHYAQQDEDLFMKLITTISNCSTFTNNQNALREAGCLEALWDLLKSSAPERIKSVVTQAMANLAVNEVNQSFLKECIPDLVATIKSAQFEGLQLNCLNVLVNLSVLGQNHAWYSDQTLNLLYSKFDVVSQSTDSEKFQTLKILVNLSCNDETIPRLLNAKMPQLFLGLYFNLNAAENVLLRITVFLRNILRYVASHVESICSLSACDPESLGYLLSAAEVTSEIRSRSITLNTVSQNQELRTLTGEILAFCAAL